MEFLHWNTVLPSNLSTTTILASHFHMNFITIALTRQGEVVILVCSSRSSAYIYLQNTMYDCHQE